MIYVPRIEKYRAYATVMYFLCGKKLPQKGSGEIYYANMANIDKWILSRFSLPNLVGKG